MPSAHGAHIKYAWQHQPDAALNQPNPVSGTIYPVLAATEDVHLIGIGASVTWTVQPSPLEVYVIIDGITYTAARVNPISATSYFLFFTMDAAQPTLAVGSLNVMDREGMDGHSVAVSAETTGGTVQNLTCRVKWARLLPT